MMLLCDYINISILKSEDEQEISMIKQLGNLFELEITVIRDLKKWQKDILDGNLYTYWLMAN